MNGDKLRLRAAAFVLILALTFSLALPCSAFFWNRRSRSVEMESSASPRSAFPDDLAPTAKNQELYTYRNVALAGRLEAAGPKGGRLTYQVTAHPVRGSVLLSEDGSGSFVYTPYENKLGRDAFRFTVQDEAGNISAPAEVRIRIVRPDTRVTYEDMNGHPAHKAALRLAEEGIFVGEQLGGHWFFHPDRPVTRAEFLAMAMNTVKENKGAPLMLTGFHDDEAIPVWAKPYVASALRAGVVSGSKDEYGAPVFAPEQVITCGESSVILDKLLQLPDVPLEVFSPGCSGWAVQAAANLSASGQYPKSVSSAALSQPLTMGEAAQLLDGALTVLDRRS